MSEHRLEKVSNTIKELLGAFIEENSNRQSMITITNIFLTSDFKRVTIFVTVFPEHSENAGLDFLKRQRSEAKMYLKKKSRLGRIPFIDFELDKGEKARQRLDEISKDL
ncbi:MAG: ribosome-binding factor A [Candidatus Paceibacterota bacterium]